MKFGIRTPSFGRRLAARTSWKRVVRHSLGLKAPRGWGWLTNPKKAAYNRIYNRTSVSLDRLLAGGSRRRQRYASSTTNSNTYGLIILVLVIGYLLYAVVHNTSALQLSFVVIGLVALAGAVFWLRRRYEAKVRAAEEAARQERRNELLSRFGAEHVERVLNGVLWIGATSEMVVEMFGSPSEVDERVLKTKTKTIYKYFPTGRNRFALRVTLDDGVVVKWNDKRI